MGYLLLTEGFLVLPVVVEPGADLVLQLLGHVEDLHVVHRAVHAAPVVCLRRRHRHKDVTDLHK